MVSNTEILTAKLAKEPLGTARHAEGHRARRPQLEPGRALAAVAHPERQQAGPVCGWVDFVAQAGEVKDYFATGAAFEARYRTPFDVTEAEYRNWSAKLLAALREAGREGPWWSERRALRAHRPRGRAPGHEQRRRAGDRRGRRTRGRRSCPSSSARCSPGSADLSVWLVIR